MVKDEMRGGRLYGFTALGWCRALSGSAECGLVAVRIVRRIAVFFLDFRRDAATHFPNRASSKSGDLEPNTVKSVKKPIRFFGGRGHHINIYLRVQRKNNVLCECLESRWVSDIRPVGYGGVPFSAGVSYLPTARRSSTTRARCHTLLPDRDR